MPHAKLSPSSSARWTKCALAPSLEDGREDTTSEAAMRGTIAHDIAAKELTNAAVRLDDLRGHYGVVCDDGAVLYYHVSVNLEGKAAFLVDDEIAGWVTSYVTLVRELVSKGNGTLHVEVSVPIDHMTDEEGATGTSDVVIEFPDGEWLVVDLKTGSNRVMASKPFAYNETGLAEFSSRKPNTQLVMYASGALRELDVFDSAKRVRLMIVQPSLSHVDEYAMTLHEFRNWESWVKSRAIDTRSSDPIAKPDYDTCLYCKAKSDCKPRAEFVLKTIAPTADGFENIEELESLPVVEVCHTVEAVEATLDSISGFNSISRVWPHLDFIEKWVQDQRERAAKAVTAGEVIRFENGKVLGYVPGKKGNRAWLDGAEEKLKSFGLKKDEMYEQTLISPTKAEELLLGGEKPSKVRWERLQPFIGQKEGKPKLAMIDPPEQGFAEVQPADQPVVAEPVLTIDDNDLY